VQAPRCRGVVILDGVFLGAKWQIRTDRRFKTRGQPTGSSLLCRFLVEQQPVRIRGGWQRTVTTGFDRLAES